MLSSQYKRQYRGAPDRGHSVSNRDEVYRLLEPFNAHVLSGHTHEQEHVFEGGVREHIHGAVCGAWWSGDICFDGTPNGYSVYEVSGSELRWRYKSTGMPADYQIRPFAAGADPAAPDEIVANVWDWDPEWTVCWYENGERKGMMSRRRGIDPLTEKSHRGPELPSHRPWVEPMVTDHLFYCPAPRDGSTVKIEAVDPWGRTYVSDVPET